MELELTLLLQGQLALSLDVLQRGRQVAGQAAHRARWALGRTAGGQLWGQGRGLAPGTQEPWLGWPWPCDTQLPPAAIPWVRGCAPARRG